MTVAQKLTAIGENVPKVYDAGKQWVFTHVTQPSGLFYRAVFREEALSLALPDTNGALTDMFRMVTGLQRIRLTLPKEVTYKLNYFAYSASLTEIAFPGGIRVSDFTNFANRCSQLQKVEGEIDLSESSNNTGCFGSCTALREVRFKPESILLSISFKQSEELSGESVASILEGLGTVSQTQTLTLHDTVKASLSDAQIAALEAKNWQLEQ